MLRLLLAATAHLALVASPAGALTLTVERSTGEAWLENLSDGTEIFDGYQIVSAAALLDQDGRRSFQDWTAAAPAAANSVLGSLTWGEFVVHPDSFVEINLVNHTTANPGFKAYLGHPITRVVDGDLSFYYSDFTKPPAERNTLGEVRIVGLPTPTAGLLALLGAPSLLLLRRTRRPAPGESARQSSRTLLSREP